MNKLLLAAFILIGIFISPLTAYAHVVVTPSQVGIAEERMFNISVPNEQQTPVVNVKLLIPKGVASVVPTSKAGWTIEVSVDSGSKSSDATAITWSGGTIPVGQRDDFSFSAQAPANATQLEWKAYQTYADGTVVHWDQKPSGSDDSSGNAGPYSITNVINDLSPKPKSSLLSLEGRANIALVLSVVSLAIVGVILLKRRP